jgi:hypothetical protein
LFETRPADNDLVLLIAVVASALDLLAILAVVEAVGAIAVFDVFLRLGLNEAGKRLEPNEAGIKLLRFSFVLGAFFAAASKRPALVVVLAMACATAVVAATTVGLLLVAFVLLVITANTDILERLAASALLGLALLVLVPVPA